MLPSPRSPSSSVRGRYPERLVGRVPASTDQSECLRVAAVRSTSRALSPCWCLPRVPAGRERTGEWRWPRTAPHLAVPPAASGSAGRGPSGSALPWRDASTSVPVGARVRAVGGAVLGLPVGSLQGRPNSERTPRTVGASDQRFRLACVAEVSL